MKITMNTVNNVIKAVLYCLARLLAGVKAVEPEPLLLVSDSPDAVIRLFASTRICVSCSSKSDTADTRSRQGRQQPEQHKKKDYRDYIC